MERPERYDPEDIENLLHERSFDELLAEERAYVLRHLSGREEYEAMRRLLLNVRQGQVAGPGPSPEPGVREAVLRAFRERNRPAWHIWLNSVAAFWPGREDQPAWRPALVMVMVAVLIVAGMFVARQWGGVSDHQLAQIHRERTESKLEPLPVPGPSTSEESLVEHDAVDGNGPGHVAGNSERTAVPEAETTAPEQVKKELLEKDASEDHQEASALLAPDPGPAMTIEASEDEHFELVAPVGSRIVMADELARNQSLTNVSGKAATVAAKGREASVRPKVTERSRSLAQDAELIALVTAGW